MRGSEATEAIYTYDDIYQLTNVTYPSASSTTYNYDGVGNRLSIVDGGTATYVPNNMNQYDSVGGAAYTYDDNGNLTNTPTSTYTYDYENRLVSYTLAPGGEGQGEGAYTYDAFGRRIQKNINGSIATYIHDGDQVICEYDSTGSLTAKYIYGPGIDEPICKLVIASEPEASEAIYYYHFDGLGSVTNLTDSIGTVVESYSYDVYGKPLTTSSVGNPYLFTARDYDPETGLYYYRARYYSPRIGRFLQTDPIGYNGGINLYTYVSNNPVNWVDPWGLDRSKWGLPIEIQISSDPFDAYAAAFGPLAIAYGPSYREQHELVQESIREHEYTHVGQWGWGLRDIYDKIRGRNSSREIEAYQKQKEFIENKLKDLSLDKEARKALEKMLEEIKWFLEHPEEMWW